MLKRAKSRPGVQTLIEPPAAGFDGRRLEFRQIDERTAPAILASLVKYEAVHRIDSWHALKRRLQADRGCFGFFDPARPDEPVIFTELAFTRTMAGRVTSLLDPDAPVIDPASCRYAMFYSISRCYHGLNGLSFGNALILRVIDVLAGEMPWLKKFATVSPIPGFRAWLEKTRAGDGEQSLANALARVADPQSLADAARTTGLGRDLTASCARYLLHAKHEQEPTDPVARFHLRNGARLERLNWLGDFTPVGLQRSACLTANYVYPRSELRRNQQAYLAEHRVLASRSVEQAALAGLG